MAKVNLYPDFKELFKLLNSARTKYLMLGGYAVVYHGYARLTQDIDVWIGTSDKNVEKVARVICEWGGYPPEQVSPSLFQQPGKVFVFGHPPVRVDLLTRPDGVQFRACYKRRGETKT
jgi:hypothetical protein